MIRKSLMALAMVCLLAASAPISAEMASEEGAVEESPLNLVDEGSTTADVDEMNNGSSSNSTGQSSTKIVIDLSTLGNDSAKAEGPEATVISYTLPATSDDGDGAEVTDQEVTDVRILSEALGASVAEDALNLSTLDNGSAEAGDSEMTVISYSLPSSDTSDGKEAIDVRVLGNVLGRSPSENVTDLSTLGWESATEDDDNGTETNYTSLSSDTTDELEVTDVKALSEVLGY